MDVNYFHKKVLTQIFDMVLHAPLVMSQLPTHQALALQLHSVFWNKDFCRKCIDTNLKQDVIFTGLKNKVANFIPLIFVHF